MNPYLFKLQYKSIRQIRKIGKVCGIAVFLHVPLTFNIRHDLRVNNGDIEYIV